MGVMSLAASESTQAALIDRGNGLIYDNVLNVTWMQDVALSGTLGGAGIFNWSGAKAWANQLVYGGYDDWRLPTLTPVNGVRFNRIFHCDGRPITDMASLLPAARLPDSPAMSLHTCTTSILGTSLIARERAIFTGQDLGAERRRSERKLRGCLDGRNGILFQPTGHKDVTFGPTSLLPIDFTWLFKYNGFNDWANTIKRPERGPYVTAMY